MMASINQLDPTRHACLLNQRVTEQEKLDPALKAASDRTDLIAMAVIAVFVGFFTAAATGSVPAGITVGTSIFLFYLLTRETTIWFWPDFSWGSRVVVSVPPPRRDPHVVVVHDRPSHSIHVPHDYSHGTVGERRLDETSVYVPTYDRPPSDQQHVESSYGTVGVRNVSHTPPPRSQTHVQSRDSEYGTVGGRRIQ